MKDMIKKPIIQRFMESVVGFAIIAILAFLMLKDDSPSKRWPEVKKKTFTSINLNETVSFKIYPGKTSPNDYSNAIEFVGEGEKERLVVIFFEAITDSRYYHPQHDHAIDQWGVQIRTTTTTLRIGCYIPDIQPDVVVGIINSGSQEWYFQSRQLYQWYQKYSHRWLEPEGALPTPVPQPEAPGGG